MNLVTALAHLSTLDLVNYLTWFVHYVAITDPRHLSTDLLLGA